jgi:primase-polymerase (primpol)-like protein
LYTKERMAAIKEILPVKIGCIPEELKIRPQWVVWKAVGEGPQKIPYSAKTGRKASATDLLSWSSFDEANEALRSGQQYSGLGFVFSSGDPFAGIDLDGCVDPQTGEVAAWAMEIVRYFDSYTELSASGTGIHIIVKGLEVPNRRKDKVEIYSSKRFFTLSGHLLEV